MNVDEDDEDELYIGELNSSQDKSQWETNLKISDINIQFKMDTGADVTCIH